MNDISRMFENIDVAILASDAHFKVIYQNKKCRQLFKEELNRADYIGVDLSECHKPEETEKIKGYFREYRKKTRRLDYYVMDESNNRFPRVNPGSLLLRLLKNRPHLCCTETRMGSFIHG